VQESGEVEYDPFSSIADPYPAYRTLLEASSPLPGPFPSMWVVAGWEQVRRVLADRSFSADRRRSTLFQSMPTEVPDPNLAEKLTLFDRILLTLDPPDHTRLRRLVSHAFTPRVVESLQPRIRAMAEELCEQMTDRVDLIATYAYPLPVMVIAELLGLPKEDRDRLKRWSDDVALLLDPFPSQEALQRFEVSIGEFRAYLDAVFDERRRRPGPDLISGLVAARDGDDALDDEELFALVVLLIAAGHETTTNLIGNAVIALTRHPDQRQLVLHQPEVWPNAVEELLRFDSPVQRTSRVATRSGRLGDVLLQPGDLVVLVLGAANHDPRVFERPEELRLTRPNASQHLSFGHGIHHCLGAPLARLEGRVALEALYRRFPRLEADVDGLDWKPSIVLRGVEKLTVALGGD
jgi:cytochrome P450